MTIAISFRDREGSEFEAEPQGLELCQTVSEFINCVILINLSFFVWNFSIFYFREKLIKLIKNSLLLKVKCFNSNAWAPSELVGRAPTIN